MRAQSRGFVAAAAAAVMLAACGANGVDPDPDLRSMMRASPMSLSEAEVGGRIDVASFDAEGRLLYPQDVDEWVALGASIGMDYADDPGFDPENPGPLGVVTMEPTAYRYFKETGRFADGTMFQLTFHRPIGHESFDDGGLATGPARALEIHYRDSEMFPQGFNFFMFQPGQPAAAQVPLPNDCVACHMEHGAFEGTFAQFYPSILARIAQGSAE